MTVKTTILYVIIAVLSSFVILEILQRCNYLDETENVTAILPSLALKVIACKWMKCCDAFVLNIHGDNTLINLLLHEKIHGQKIAIDAMLATIKCKYGNILQGSPITMELYGPPGTGKSYSSTLLAQGLFFRGMDTPLVHTFDGSDIQYTGQQLISYKENLKSWIAGNLSQCKKNMFIFKHTEIIPEELLQVVNDAIKSKKGGIFIFTTTEMSPIVSQLYHHHLKLGKSKNSMKKSHFRPAFRRTLFGMRDRILFLPMDEQDLISCMLDHFESLGIFMPPQSLVEKILDQTSMNEYRYTNKTCRDIVQMVDQNCKV